ncbi:MAG: UDP-N-acetylglucosamine 1-carboxyvinyltransferase [Aestuariivita sp.]|nr:UDP-N-acetylglucosamine 1-carboxyvinyltransferase [Aestuariivita sp.]MCY4345245.1 UDP-N-acetylglucosamine 1-carboxyvinyltransferase [Aestuariivita sp.]
MDQIVVQESRALQGSIPIAGAKNACLALMPLSLLTEEPLILTNIPRLSDILTMEVLLESLGTQVTRYNDQATISLSSRRISKHLAHYDIVRKMRASILVLGPLLARAGQAIVSLPGGCAIGARPVDLHLAVLEALGARLDLQDGYVRATASRGLIGETFTFPIISVGATANAVMAATLAKGTTVLKNAAQEPEILDLVACLKAMGAQITGEGTRTIVIEGVDSLSGARHEVVADRIELGTYMLVPAITQGSVELIGGRRNLLADFCRKLEEADVLVTETPRGITVSKEDERIKPVDVTTAPFPGFPTDLQAQMMVLLCRATGVSRIEEKIFENRFMHVPELVRMGAEISIHGGVAKVTGPAKLRGAPVMATDLRASMSLILAGLVAQGETIVNRVYHLDRGYEQVEQKLRGVGAKIMRIRNK